MTFEGTVLRGNDALRNCGVDDGNTVHVIQILHGGGMHKNKKSQGRAEKKRELTPRGPKQP